MDGVPFTERALGVLNLGEHAERAEKQVHLLSPLTCIMNAKQAGCKCPVGQSAHSACEAAEADGPWDMC